MRKVILCQNCHKRAATREYHDGIDLWHLCGYCLRAFRAVDSEYDRVISQIDPDIAPDEWADEEDE